MLFYSIGDIENLMPRLRVAGGLHFSQFSMFLFPFLVISRIGYFDDSRLLAFLQPIDFVAVGIEELQAKYLYSKLLSM